MIFDSEGTGFTFYIRDNEEAPRGIEWFVADDGQITQLLQDFRLAMPLALRLSAVARVKDPSALGALDTAIYNVLSQMPEVKSRVEASKHNVEDFTNLSIALVRYIAQNPGIYELSTSPRY